MVLDDRHISYLRSVQEGIIKLWWAPKKMTSRYVCSDWSNGRKEVDQTVAAQMKALGLTHIISKAGNSVVELTLKGENVLIEEDEAWA